MFSEWLHNMWFRLQALLKRRQFERDLAEELEFHLAMREQKLIEQGMSPQDARYAARRGFGNAVSLKEKSREMWGFPSLETLLQDVRYGLRMLAKNPGFTAIAVLTLALGIGANTAIFSIVYAVMLRPLPYSNPGRLVMLWQTFPKQGWREVPFSAADFIDIQEQNRVFEQTAAIFLDKPDYNVTGRGEPERVYGTAVSANLFALLGARAELGRTFLAGEDQPGREHVALLSHSLWQRRFQGDAQVIGKAVVLDAQAYTIVGVMPPGFRFPPPMASVSKSFPVESAVWLPFVLDRTNRHYHPLAGIARLKPGVTLAQARTELKDMASRLEAQYPDTDSGLSATAYSLSQQVAESVRPALTALAGAVALILLIACVNVANLLLSRAAVRGREMALRAALGASRGRLGCQMLAESLLLSALGGAFGALLAWWGVKVIRPLGGGIIPRISEVTIDGRVLGFTAFLAALTGLAFGLLPVLNASHSSSNELLKGGRGTVPRRQQRFQSMLASSEVALALVPLVGAGLLIRSFVRLQEVDPGFRTDHLLTLSLRLSESKFREERQIRQFCDQLLRRVQVLPGVQSCGLVNSLPIAGWQGTTVVYVEGRLLPASMLEAPMANYRVASPTYFKTVGIPLVRGRYLSDQDTDGRPRAIVISETMARRVFPIEDPIGKQLRLDNPKNPAFTVVGVVGDIRDAGLDAPVASEMYAAHAQDPWSIMSLTVRAAGDPLTLASPIRNQVWALDKDQPVFNVKSMDDIVSESFSSRRFNMLVLGLFSALALMLTAVGIYGVISYSVSQRSHEIGIRMALGAQRLEAQCMVLRRALTLALIGVAAGIGGSMVLMRTLRSLLFGVSATDPIVLGSVALGLIFVALVASYLPARRATKVDPMVALRYD